MGVNLWGESPLSVNPVNELNTLAKVLAKGKGGIVKNLERPSEGSRVAPRNLPLSDPKR
ncbi:MAG: hypothetical protein KKG97_00360 [Proteobacteria bacterium]|nr:hypothetical protein [Pseudomonadota bacterium]